jgi:DHA3 family macrolide efflux protein-like MFS transporter
MFVRSLASSFHGAAMSASTSLMVPVEHLTRIQGINQMLNGGLNGVSAPLGALLLGILPIQDVLLIDVGTALLAILPLCFIRVPQPERLERERGQEGEQATIWQDFQAGCGALLGDWGGFKRKMQTSMVGLMGMGVGTLLIGIAPPSAILMAVGDVLRQFMLTGEVLKQP